MVLKPKKSLDFAWVDTFCLYADKDSSKSKHFLVSVAEDH